MPRAAEEPEHIVYSLLVISRERSNKDVIDRDENAETYGKALD